jgi:SAM-dependent methyltransferase
LSELTEHARRNRAAWDLDAPSWVEPGRRNWASEAPSWGTWDVPESDLGILPPGLSGADVVELGCGTAYWSAWLARRGARVVGVDNSRRQLDTARAFQVEFGLEFPLLHASAEAVPLPDASFDLAFSEYGASLWCDPELWIPEAARLLRPGGWLIFLTSSPLLVLCMPDEEAPAGERLLRDQAALRRIDWPGADEGVEFHLPHGEMLELLRGCGFAVERLVELHAPASAEGVRHFVPAAWAKRWPCEEIWVARRTSEYGGS